MWFSVQELKDPHCRDEMAAARGALKKNATMLYTASQAFLRHPDVAATRANRDYVFKQVQEAIAGISNAAQATSPTDENKGHTGIGELAAALNEFDVSMRSAWKMKCFSMQFTVLLAKWFLNEPQTSLFTFRSVSSDCRGIDLLFLMRNSCLLLTDLNCKELFVLVCRNCDKEVLFCPSILAKCSHIVLNDGKSD